MAIKERHATLDEKRFRLQRERAKASVQQLEHKAATGKRLTQDDIRKIQEIYGIYEADSSSHDQAHNDEEN